MAIRIIAERPIEDVREVRFLVSNIGEGDSGQDIPFVFRRRIEGTQTNSATGKTVSKMVSQFNHFLEWMRLREREEDYIHLFHIISKINNVLDVNLLSKKATELYKGQPDTYATFLDAKTDLYKQAIYEHVINDNFLLRAIEDYCFKNSTMNLEKTPVNMSAKLSKIDLHITCVCSVYLKFMYIFYFRAADCGKFEAINRGIIYDLFDKVNEFVAETRYPEHYSALINDKYLTRLYDYLSYYANAVIPKNKSVMTSKLGGIGFTNDYIISATTYDIIAGFTRISPLDVTASQTFKIGDSIDDYTFIHKAVVKYIYNTTRNKLSNLFGCKLRFVIKNLSCVNDDEDGMSSSDKLMMYTEKVDAEISNEKEELKDYILNQCEDEMSEVTKKLAIEYNRNWKPHPLVELMVSIYLEQEYGVDVSDVMDEAELFIVTMRIYERLNSLINMKFALIGFPSQPRYNNSINISDLNMVNFSANPEKVAQTLSNFCKEEYIVNTENGIHHFEIKNDLIVFFNEKRGVI